MKKHDWRNPIRLTQNKWAYISRSGKTINVYKYDKTSPGNLCNVTLTRKQFLTIYRKLGIKTKAAHS